MTGLRGAAALAFALAAAPAFAGANGVSPAEHRVRAGAQTFRAYCVRCHGPDASGCGISARLYQPRPANLTVSASDDAYKTAIIRDGGSSVGRSPFMPPWVGELDESQIRDVVAYIGSLARKPSPAC